MLQMWERRWKSAFCKRYQHASLHPQNWANRKPTETKKNKNLHVGWSRWVACWRRCLIAFLHLKYVCWHEKTPKTTDNRMSGYVTITYVLRLKISHTSCFLATHLANWLSLHDSFFLNNEIPFLKKYMNKDIRLNVF